MKYQLDNANELIFTMLISNKYLVQQKKAGEKENKKVEKVKISQS